MNIQKMMQEAQKLQNALKKKNAEFNESTFEYSYKEFVKITMRGNLHIESIDINKDIVDADDVSMLNDIVQEAINNAIEQTNKKRDEINSSLMPPGMGGMNGLF